MDIIKALSQQFSKFLVEIKSFLIELSIHKPTGSSLTFQIKEDKTEHFDGVIKPSFYNAGNVPVKVDGFPINPGVLIHWDYPFVFVNKTVKIQFIPDPNITDPKQLLYISWGSYHTNKY